MIPVFLIILIYQTKFQFPKKAIMVEKLSDLKTSIVLQINGEGYPQEYQKSKDSDTIDVEVLSDITIKIAGGISPIVYKTETNYNSKIIKGDIDKLLQKIDEFTTNQ
jgi:hypothetical protein